MSRKEFTRKTKAARALHAGGLCEYCGLKPKGLPEYDHYQEAGDDGDNSFENCRHVCAPCHAKKTKHYVQERRKAERIRDKANGSLKTKRPMNYTKQPQNRATRPVGKLYEFIEQVK